jgi:hypothetical protein
MDKLKPQGHLEAIEQRIVEGKKFIARQQEVVDSLRRHGCDTRDAENCSGNSSRLRLRIVLTEIACAQRSLEVAAS